MSEVMEIAGKKGRVYMKVGIDLGTTNSAVSYINEHGSPEIVKNSDGERTTPSVILIEDQKAIIGMTAKEAAAFQSEDTIQFVKRQMGNNSFEFPLPGTDQLIGAVEASAFILKRIVQDAEQELGETITDVVITVPAYFDDAKRNATKEAAEMIGVNVLKIINEPTAAALAYYNLEEKTTDQNVAIYDLGGGTFDISIVNIQDNEVKVLATDGDANLGGFDFDNAIFNYVADAFEEETGLDLYDDDMAMQDLRDSTEKCKKSLTKRDKSLVAVSSQGQTIRKEITKTLFNDLIESYLARTSQIMEETIGESNLTWNDITKVLLVGGSTRTPAISDMIERLTGIEPSKDLNPDEVVALGAAVQASSIEPSDQDSRHHIVVRDVNSHSLGIITGDGQNPDENSIILERNTEIPCERSKSFVTVQDNQESVMVQVTEGEDEDPDYVTIIGTSEVALPDNLPMGSPLEINIAYDKNGIVHVGAKDLSNQVDLGEFVIERQSNLTQEEYEERQETMLAMEVE
ncbi:Hsp70 family protein [Lentibacillus kimchii]